MATVPSNQRCASTNRHAHALAARNGRTFSHSKRLHLQPLIQPIQKPLRVDRPRPPPLQIPKRLRMPVLQIQMKVLVPEEPPEHVRRHVDAVERTVDPDATVPVRGFLLPRRLAVLALEDPARPLDRSFAPPMPRGASRRSGASFVEDRVQIVVRARRQQALVGELDEGRGPRRCRRRSRHRRSGGARGGDPRCGRHGLARLWGRRARRADLTDANAPGCVSVDRDETGAAQVGRLFLKSSEIDKP